MSYHCEDWIVEGRLKRREIRHGGGPEELPHKKKSKKKKRKRVDHKHEYAVIVEGYFGREYIAVRCKVCNKYNHKKTMYLNKMHRK